jgi:hypothetical protein
LAVIASPGNVPVKIFWRRHILCHEKPFHVPNF